MKQCSKCKNIKEENMFYAQKSSRDGLRVWCKECMNKNSVEWKKNNPDRLAELVKTWFLNNKEKMHKSAKKWRDSHAEEKRESVKRWKSENKESLIIYSHNRRKNIINGGKLYAKEWRELCNKYDNRCLCCGKQGKMTPDHVIPLCKGGENTIKNIQPLCLKCNMSKGIKIIDFRKGKME